MAEEVDNIILEHLRHIRGRVDVTAEDVRDLKIRTTNLEESTATGMAGIHRRMDRFDDRLERIERRLDLVDEPATDAGA